MPAVISAIARVIVARVADGPRVEVKNHAVAEMSAGIGHSRVAIQGA